jgi:uncharacterized membrane protein YphA (DoxX/SURF4 family)
MKKLSDVGRIFYGISIAGIGFPTIYYKSFPYMLFPPEHFLNAVPAILYYITGTLLILIGACIVFEIKTRQVSLLFGGVLLLIFCFCFVPYEFMVNSNYKHLAEWENAEKELQLAGGAFLIAGCFSEKNENHLYRFLGKLIPFGAIFFAIPIISYGILHFQFAKDVSTMVPSWIPNPIFWTYFAGTALLGSGIAIIFKIKPVLIAALLGTMIFIWFIIIHVPGVIASSSADLEGQVTSAFLALAYSGIAFVIAGAAKKKVDLHVKEKSF